MEEGVVSYLGMGPGHSIRGTSKPNIKFNPSLFGLRTLIPLGKVNQLWYLLYPILRRSQYLTIVYMLFCSQYKYNFFFHTVSTSLQYRCSNISSSCLRLLVKILSISLFFKILFPIHPEVEFTNFLGSRVYLGFLKAWLKSCFQEVAIHQFRAKNATRVAFFTLSHVFQ